MGARLLSVNVGLPRDIVWQGRTVRTAIWKQPVQGPRTVRRFNIDGDGQGDLAGHGGENRAVFVYQRDSYQYWESQLGRSDLVHGQFGENFTVDGLSDDEVRVGDRYRIGSALFEVTQPRVTCYRVGIRLNEPRMAALLVAHGRPGFYFRVLEEGEVQAGDAVARLARGPEDISIADINALLYKPGHAPARLEQALRIPALSPGWRSSFQALLATAARGDATRGNPGLAPAAEPPAWQGFRALAVADKRRESDDVTSLILKSADGRPLAPGRPGQFIVLRLHLAPDAPPELRSYSLSGMPGADRYRVSVKRHEGSAAGGYIHGDVRIGDIIEASAPRGSFVLAPGSEPVVLLSGGIGVTPLLAMLHALAAERSPREVWWVHGARNGRAHPFAEEVRACLHALPRAHAHIRFSAPGPADRPGADFDASGHAGVETLKTIGAPRAADFYLCGPPGFLADLRADLVAWGVPAGRIRSEMFGAGPAFTPGIAAAPPRQPHPPAGAVAAGPLVSFARSGLNVRWNPACQSILELAEACDVPVRWSCRTGVCHQCETSLISGRVGYRPDPIEPPAAGNILLCCSQPTGDVVLDL
jgi:ferredoxin-NADP reductase/MOSC domain-containing protein YiiM